MENNAQLSTDETKLYFARYLKQLRKQANLSKEALSLSSHVSEKAIKKFERSGDIDFADLIKLWAKLDNLEALDNLVLTQAQKEDIKTSHHCIDNILTYGL
ncbi:helix-turn-helix domain-containing protein [Catenovulum maritimum]|uniref:HTH cro/C1-type domain-containing protein n=1 Tax=Catenovulum maritimum TaxID=1513271 RepID=A0A0J8GZR7_9ALTE|nr:helix-turn-helix transcriptional regulator [Catenovulum maritimum]KMT66729.1 hypothetical protein XM47_00965 [Catenovulum maritimum]